MCKSIMSLLKQYSIRELKCIDDYLLFNNQGEYKISFFRGDNELIKKKINDFLCGCKREVDNDFIKNIVATNILPIENFDWLKNNKDACAFIWGYLVLSPDNLIWPNIFFENSNVKSSLNLSGNQFVYNRYRDLDLDVNAISHDERYLLIVRYFDSNVINLNALGNVFIKGDVKRDVMNKLKELWHGILMKNKKLKWLSVSNSDSCEWGWQYLLEYSQKEAAKPSFFNKEITGRINSLSIFTPHNAEEKNLYIYSVLQLWNCHHSEKTLLISNMSKAWRQRQLRQERDDRKSINVYVDISVKNKLDKLAEINRCRINEMLVELINNEYKRIVLDQDR